MNNADNNKEINFNVNCSVTDCIYHNGVADCTAPFVNIKNKSTFFSIGTVCDTYKPRKM